MIGLMLVFASSALVTAIDHVGIAVPDLDAAIAWYTRPNPQMYEHHD